MKNHADKFLAKVEPPPSAAKLGLEMFPSANGGWKWVGQCPACAVDGNDATGNHLVVYQTGHFGCVSFQGEAGDQHRARMAKLCPALRGGKPTGPVYIKPDLTAEREALKAASLKLWDVIRTTLASDIAALGKSGTIDMEDARWQFASFCDLFHPSDLVWVGHRNESRESFRRHLFRAGDMAERERIFKVAQYHGLDHTRGVSWKPDACSRENCEIAAYRVTVLEHDHVAKPEQIALIRYAKEVLKWDLRMVIDTTGKSLHGLFDVSAIPLDTVRAQMRTLANMGADPHSLAQCATRAPGMIRQPDPDDHGKPNGDMQLIRWIAP
jgi:hypothetical protein